MKEKTKGFLYCMTGGVLCALGGVCIKFIPWNAMEINAARHLISLVIVGIYLAVTHHPFKINKQVLSGAVALAGTHIAYTYATKLTAAGNAIVLEYASPIFVILISALFFREKPKKLDLWTCAIVFGGILCFFIDSLSAGNAVGNACGVLAGICYATFYVMSSREESDALVGLLLANAICVVVGLPSLLKTDFAHTSVETWLWLLGLGVFQVALANLFLAHGLKTTPAITANLLAAIEPVLNPLLVAWLYHEYLTPLALTGAAIVFVTVVVYNTLKIKAKEN